MRLLRGLSELTYVKCLEPCLAHSEHSGNVSSIIVVTIIIAAVIERN